MHANNVIRHAAVCTLSKQQGGRRNEGKILQSSSSISLLYHSCSRVAAAKYSPERHSWWYQLVQYWFPPCRSHLSSAQQIFSPSKFSSNEEPFFSVILFCIGLWRSSPNWDLGTTTHQFLQPIYFIYTTVTKTYETCCSAYLKKKYFYKKLFRHQEYEGIVFVLKQSTHYFNYCNAF